MFKKVYEMSKERLFYIDNLRILLAILVILFNLALLYGTPLGDRPYHESKPPGLIESIIESILYLSFFAVTQSFFMGFFFMISGYFTPGSYDRKGAWPFFKDRLFRLGIPLLFYIIFIHPTIGYAIALSTKEFTGSFLEFLALYIGNYRVLGSGPLWFLEALLIFNGAYVLWCKLVKSANTEIKIPENKIIAIFALILGIVTFIVRIWFPSGWNFKPLNFEIPFFPQYIAMFIVGLIAYRGNWQISKEKGKLWFHISLFLLMLFPFLIGLYLTTGNPIRYYGGFYWQAFTYALWEQFIGVSIIIALSSIFREKYDTQGRLMEAMSKSAYTVYIIHAPIIVLLALSLQGITMNPFLKFVLVAPLAVAICFLIGNYMRKILGHM
jgi:glucan biosynthesis protein C